MGVRGSKLSLAGSLCRDGMGSSEWWAGRGGVKKYEWRSAYREESSDPQLSLPTQGPPSRLSQARNTLFVALQRTSYW